jgi:hypothetical protein
MDVHCGRAATSVLQMADRNVGCKVAAHFLCYYRSAVVVLHDGGGHAAPAGEPLEPAADGGKQEAPID